MSGWWANTEHTRTLQDTQLDSLSRALKVSVPVLQFHHISLSRAHSINLRILLQFDE